MMNMMLIIKFTPWSKVLHEKLTATKLFKKFPVFYGTRRSITVFTRARHWSHTYPDHTLPPYFPNIYSNILPSTPSLVSGLFHSDFLTKTLYAFFIPSIRATYPAYIIILDLIAVILSGEVHSS